MAIKGSSSKRKLNNNHWSYQHCFSKKVNSAQRLRAQKKRGRIAWYSPIVNSHFVVFIPSQVSLPLCAPLADQK